MPEFNFEVPSVESTPVEPVMPEFNFEVPSVESTPVEPAMPEFNFEVPSVESTSVEPAMPEFNFEVPSVESTPVEPAMPEFNFEVPSVESTSVEPAMPEFNFEVPSVESTPVEPAMPEFNFEVPNVESTPVEPVMPEFNFEVPSVESTPVEPVMETIEHPRDDSGEGTHRGGLFNLFGKNKKSTETKVEPQPEINVETNGYELPIDTNDSIVNISSSEPTMPESLNTPTIETVPLENKNIRLAIDTIRNCEDNLNKMGFTVEVDELDLDGSYQINIKINK